MVANPKDAIVPNNFLTELFLDKHVDFLSNYDSNQTTKYDYAMSESLRMSGIYWAVTALDIMNGKEKMDKAEVKIYKVYSCNCFDINTMSLRYEIVIWFITSCFYQRIPFDILLINTN